jgi:hypothetical protein
MNGHEERYDRSQDNTAKLIAFLSPYLFWGTVGALLGIFVLFTGLAG